MLRSSRSRWLIAFVSAVGAGARRLQRVPLARRWENWLAVAISEEEHEGKRSKTIITVGEMAAGAAHYDLARYGLTRADERLLRRYAPRTVLATRAYRSISAASLDSFSASSGRLPFVNWSMDSLRCFKMVCSS